MPKEGKKILKYNHGGKFMKVWLIIYADLESFLEKKSTFIIIQKSYQQLK